MHKEDSLIMVLELCHRLPAFMLFSDSQYLWKLSNNACC